MSEHIVSGCTWLELKPHSNGQYATCSHFCESKCFGECTKDANCPDNRNNTCKEKGMPDFSGGACCQKAKISNNSPLQCDATLTPEQLSLLSEKQGVDNKLTVQCCCAPHVCSKPSKAEKAPAPVIKMKPTHIPPADQPQNITVPSEMYEKLQVKRAVWLKTKAPKEPIEIKTPPPISGMPLLTANRKNAGACLVYAPHGCKSKHDNPHSGQTFPHKATTDWAVIDTANKPQLKTLKAKNDWGKDTCLVNLKENWTKWCSSRGEMHPVYTMYCIDDHRCFSDPACIDAPEKCSK